MRLVIRSTTGSAIDVDGSGVQLPATGSIIVDPKNYISWSSALEDDTAFEAKIDSGDIVVNNGSEDLTPDGAKRFLRSILIGVTIKKDGVTILDNVTEIDITGTTSSVTDGGSGRAIVNVSEAADPLVGKMFNIDFAAAGSANNKWLGSTDKDLKGNETLVPIPFDCELLTITGSFSESGTNTDIEVYKSNQGSGSSDNKILDLDVSSKRVVVLRSFTPVSCNAGDKIGVYLRGGSPKDPLVTLYFKITSSGSTDITENFSGDF